ncbi:membrane dipeptidase [Paeniglutamicibacter gangotriensis]|uniref:Membrane dipeptidase n=1 Tax=Paeniglutamicibacter gangotriensis TaxID=254787 RepID=A0A5B0EDX8_9MICC|nr:membrane dipeptidase [Paeniglutamicibacter gangotriensis]KAA0977083.1 membrane dipeptidase [Paeniglutamicibacter gangotriensis]
MPEPLTNSTLQAPVDGTGGNSAALHGTATIVDGLQISNWDRTTLEELRSGGISGVNATCAVWEGPADTLKAIGDWYQLAAKNPDLVTLATSSEQIRQAKLDGRIAVLLGFQNTSPFGDDFRMVEVFHQLGVKIAQLTYNIQNLVGGACYEPEDSGLTRFGRTIVSEMNRVGMLIDLSHVGNRTSLDAVEASVAPVAITHSNPTWFVENPRNKPDEVIRAVTDKGGVLGCCLYPLVIGGQKTTLDQFCQMIARLVDELGPDKVGLGSDCTRNWDNEFVGWLRNGRWQPEGEHQATWPEWPDWFVGPQDFPRLTDGLDKVGLDETTIRGVLGENWLRLFDDVFPGRTIS